MVQPITDYTAFFADAKQAVKELDEFKQKEKMLQSLEKELETSLKAKKKEASDAVTQTVKKRRDEISKSYDAEIAKTNDRLKKVRSKREKAKSQGEKDRIAEETRGLVQENKELKNQMKAIFHTNHVPRYCSSGLYYSLYFTRGIKEFATILLTLLLVFLALPVGVYFLIPDRKTWYLVAIYVVVILLFGGLYVMIGNSTKLLYMETLKAGRGIRDQIRANRKQIKKIARAIHKDKDDAVYDLQRFDDEIAQLNEDLAQAERKKKDALGTFDSVTKTIISDEIMGNHQGAIAQIESDLGRTTADLKGTQSAAREKQLYITDHFETYAGKEFMTLEKLTALEDVIKSGRAANISEAIVVCKNQNYPVKSTN